MDGNNKKINSWKVALVIGIVCIGSYLTNYYLRNMLSVFTPQFLSSGNYYTEEFVSILSSTYMIFYASGQLLNGFLGDIVSPKKMIFIGIAFASVSTAVFPFFENAIFQTVCFAVLGFSLSMMRGPLMKIISENTQPKHARFICVFFSFASFAGPLVASAFASFLSAEFAFVLAGALALIVVSISILTFSVMEKKGTITYKKQELKKFSSIFEVFKIEKFAFYLVIACIVETSAASISFWIPTYLTIHLGFDTLTANAIFSTIAICRAFMPFLSLMIFNAIGEKDTPLMRIAFSLSSCFFVAMIFSNNAWLDIVFLTLALMSMSVASALLWSIYIPGMGKTGRASSINGVLDCSGYIAAAVANLIFGLLMSSVGWTTVIVIWSSMGVLGLISTFLFNIKKKKPAPPVSETVDATEETPETTEE